MSDYSKVEEIIKKRCHNKTSNTGYKGVHKRKSTNFKNPYEAMFYFAHDSKIIKINLGCYDTAEKAYLARLKFIDSLK